MASRSDPAESAADAVETELRTLGDPDRAAHEARYLRSELAHLGVAVPVVRQVARRQRRGLDHDGVVALAEALWARRVHERRLAAVEVLCAPPVVLRSSDLPLLEGLLRESATWALVDPLAIGAIGAVLATDTATEAVLDRWITDEALWVRRAALLAPLRALKAGEGDWPAWSRRADARLDEREFFIRKAIGWVLREVGRRRPDLVVEWLGPRTHRASGVTVREAVKPLTAAERDRLLAAYRDGRQAV